MPGVTVKKSLPKFLFISLTESSDATIPSIPSSFPNLANVKVVSSVPLCNPISFKFLLSKLVKTVTPVSKV